MYVSDFFYFYKAQISMARRTKEEAQQTRCHIMSTALNLFCSHGLAKTSLTDIARAADLTRGAIYWHFKNKDELFISLWQELCSPLAHQLDAVLLGFPLTFAQEFDACGVSEKGLAVARPSA